MPINDSINFNIMFLNLIELLYREPLEETPLRSVKHLH